MKKKIGDLTLREFNALIKKHCVDDSRDCARDCPFYNLNCDIVYLIKYKLDKLIDIGEEK